MKKTKIIIPALGLLVLSTAASVTGTVAWFAMNNTVTATGLQVEAKSNSLYLMIGAVNENLTTIQAKTGDAAATTALSVSSEEAQVYPSAHETFASEVTPDLPASWYTASGVSQVAAGYTMKPGSKVSLTAGNFAQYVIKRSINLTVAAGSNATGAITLTLEKSAAASGKVNDAVSAVAVCGTTYLEFNEANSWANASTLVSSVTNDALTQVDFYIYYDGNNDSVYTDNAANLDGATFTFTFTAAA